MIAEYKAVCEKLIAETALVFELQAKIKELDQQYADSMAHQNNQYNQRVGERDTLQAKVNELKIMCDLYSESELLNWQPERNALLQQLEAEKLETERLTDLLCEANKDEGDGVVYALRQQLESVSKDAARYQWFRVSENWRDSGPYDDFYRDELDSQIDAAMKETP